MAERTFIIASDVSSDFIAAIMADIAQVIAAAWRDEAADHVDSGAYLAAITAAYPFGDDPDTAGAFNLAQHAEWLEYGRAGFHLPSHWTKWKVGKHGNLYAHVPFRHFTPIKRGGGASTSRIRGAMPGRVYSLARQLNSGDRLAGFGNQYKQSKSYEYYRQLFPDDDVPNTQGYTWKASPYEGMQQVGARRTPGGGTQSEYRTWRTITPDSPGWYIPPIAPLHLASNALDAAAPAIEALLAQAEANDLYRRLNEAVRPIAGLV